MSKLRSLGVAAVFLAGCAVGGASSRFVVPLASAQQAATLTKWEYMCFTVFEPADGDPKAKAAGAAGWELTTAYSHGFNGRDETWCFKRPMM